MRTQMLLLLIVTLAAGCRGTVHTAVYQPGHGPAVQLTKDFGKWQLDKTPLPPLAEIVALEASPRPVYGLYTWVGEYRDHRESIKAVGWRAVRIAGPMNDETMAMVAEDDIQVMMTLGVHVTGEAKKRPDYESDEAFIADYVKAVERFLGRYGPGGSFFKDHPSAANRPIRHVEIWNEPNFQYMIPDRQPRAEVEAEREALYAKVLPTAYKAIKAQWPDVTVVGFGAGGAAAGDIRFVQHVHALSPEVGAGYDILSTHPYMRPVPPEAWELKSWGGHSTANALASIRKAMVDGGAPGKPVWYTEVGWRVSHAEGGLYPDGREPGVTLMHQAAFVCRQYALSLRLGVPRVQVMFATDTDGFNGGMFLRDGTWRPVAYAVQTMIAMMPHPKLVAAVHDGAEGLYAYAFKADAHCRCMKRVGMVWNIDGPKTVQLPVAELIGPDRPTVEVVDMFGHRQAVEVVDGKITVEAGPCPVYVVGCKKGK